VNCKQQHSSSRTDQPSCLEGRSAASGFDRPVRQDHIWRPKQFRRIPIGNESRLAAECKGSDLREIFHHGLYAPILLRQKKPSYRRDTWIAGSRAVRHARRHVPPERKYSKFVPPWLLAIGRSTCYRRRRSDDCGIRVECVCAKQELHWSVSGTWIFHYQRDSRLRV